MRVSSGQGWRALAATAVLALAVAGCAEVEREETGVPPATPTAGATEPGEAATAGVSRENVVLAAALSGTAVVAEEGGDPDGGGTSTVTSQGAGQLCYNITVTNIARPTGAHIHQARAGEAGNIVVDLKPNFSAGAESDASGCVQAEDSLIDDIFADPADYYLQVHTQEHPDGAVRGNLSVQTP